MSRYDTMADAEIDALLLQAEAKGWNDCLDELAKEMQTQLQERKDVPSPPH